MGPIDIASMLKQLSEVSRRQSVQNKRRSEEKIAANARLLNVNPAEGIQEVNFENNEIKPEDHQSEIIPSAIKKKLKENKDEKPLGGRLNEDFKANFLDVSE